MGSARRRQPNRRLETNTCSQEGMLVATLHAVQPSGQRAIGRMLVKMSVPRSHIVACLEIPHCHS